MIQNTGLQEHAAASVVIDIHGPHTKFGGVGSSELRINAMINRMLDGITMRSLSPQSASIELELSRQGLNTVYFEVECPLNTPRPLPFGGHIILRSTEPGTQFATFSFTA